MRLTPAADITPIPQPSSTAGDIHAFRNAPANGLMLPVISQVVPSKLTSPGEYAAAIDCVEQLMQIGIITSKDRPSEALSNVFGGPNLRGGMEKALLRWMEEVAPTLYATSWVNICFCNGLHWYTSDGDITATVKCYENMFGTQFDDSKQIWTLSLAADSCSSSLIIGTGLDIIEKCIPGAGLALGIALMICAEVVLNAATPLWLISYAQDWHGYGEIEVDEGEGYEDDVKAMHSMEMEEAFIEYREALPFKYEQVARDAAQYMYPECLQGHLKMARRKCVRTDVIQALRLGLEMLNANENIGVTPDHVLGSDATIGLAIDWNPTPDGDFDFMASVTDDYVNQAFESNICTDFITPMFCQPGLPPEDGGSIYHAFMKLEKQMRVGEKIAQLLEQLTAMGGQKPQFWFG